MARLRGRFFARPLPGGGRELFRRGRGGPSEDIRYNTDHRHGGIGLQTPEDVHLGRTAVLQAERQRVLNAAYGARPERFVNGTPSRPAIPNEVWINRPQDIIECTSISQ